jgi:hypothetical protein
MATERCAPPRQRDPSIFMLPPGPACPLVIAEAQATRDAMALAEYEERISREARERISQGRTLSKVRGRRFLRHLCIAVSDGGRIPPDN